MDKHQKKNPKLSVKVNGIEKNASKKSESFLWVLPKREAEKEYENEKVIVLDKKRKKKASIPNVKKEMDNILTSKRKLKKRKEWIFFAFFAIIIGIGLGIGLLQLIGTSPKQTVTTAGTASTEKTTITLKSLEVYVLQNGVFADEKRAENVKEQLLAEGTPATIIIREKAYVISGIASNEETLANLEKRDGIYAKMFTIPAATLKNRSSQESEQMSLLVDSLNKMLQIKADTQKEEWNELEKQVTALGKMTSNKTTEELSKSILVAYEALVSEKGEVNTKTQQALLDCVSQYQTYLLNEKM